MTKDQFRIPHSAFRTRRSAQRELNPHFRHGKAIGYHYIMGAFFKDEGGRLNFLLHPSAFILPKWDRRDLNPHPPG